MIFSIIQASGVMQVPAIWGMVAFGGGVVALGGVFLYFTKDR